MTTRDWTARALEILLGAAFVAAAAFKALDMHQFAVQIWHYGVLTSTDAIRYAAFATLGVETLLGAALIGGVRLRGAVYAATTALLLGFTGLVAYAWAFRDLEDCGCFGAVLPMGPATTIAKNVAMLAVLAGAWALQRGAREEDSEQAPSTWTETVKSAAMLASFAAVAGALFLADNKAFFNPPDYDALRPFAQFQVGNGEESHDLSEGRYLAAMLSPTCDECRQSVEPLNELALYYGDPPIVGLMYGSEADRQEFEDMTQPAFPVHGIDKLLFLDLISPKQPPPRFYIIEDGKPVRHLDSLDVTLEDLLSLIEGSHGA